MAKRILIVDENQNLGQETLRTPRSNELNEILDVVLAQLIRGNQDDQGRRNLIEFLEARLIRVALEQNLNNKTRASESLGIHRKKLERKARKYQLLK